MFYEFEENTNFRRFRQLLSTFHSWLFKKDQNFHSNDKKINRIRMNSKNRKNFQFSQKDDNRNFHISTLRSLQRNHSKNRFFRLRQRKNVIAIRWRKNVTFRCFLQSNMISIECSYEIYDKKFLIIIRCLKHWRSKFENIENSIKCYEHVW